MARAALACLAAGCLAAAVQAAERPDFVWIMSDDQGYGEVSAMPGRTNFNITTPNIDALFASGMTFTDAYAGEAVCAPSRSAFLTGKHTGHAFIRGNAGTNGHDLPLPANETTFLEVLQAQGYHVACVGKWGLGWTNTTGAPHLKGCSEYYGVLDQNYAHNMYPTLPEWTMQYPAANGSLVYEGIPFPNNVGASRDTCMAPGNNCSWTHDLFMTRATAVLQQHAARKAALGDAAPPLFLYLAFTDPHAGGWTATVEEGNPVPSDGKFENETTWPVNERDHASVIVNYQDVDVGRLVTQLEGLGLRDNTAVFWASDNGASNEGGHNYEFFGSSGPLRGFKRCLTEGGIRTPFGVSWPGVVPSGVVTNWTFAFWDAAPTILDMAGVPQSLWPASMDGISAKTVFTGQTPELEHPPLYWEFCTSVHPPEEPRQGTGWGHAVRMGKWKAVSFFVDQPLRLYDLTNDIYEVHDVSGANPDIIAQIEAFAKSAHTDSVIFPVQNCRPS